MRQVHSSREVGGNFSRTPLRRSRGKLRSIVPSRNQVIHSLVIVGPLFNTFCIRNARLSAPVGIDTYNRVCSLMKHMHVKCKPKKDSNQDPIYVTRNAWLAFLFETYKCCVNNRHPARTGQLKAINNFIAEKIRYYLYGDEGELRFANEDNSHIGSIAFPTKKSKCLLRYLIDELIIFSQ